VRAEVCAVLLDASSVVVDASLATAMLA